MSFNFLQAFNSAGSVTRTFKLRVVDRMRSKPIIVPNILVNQTVDANSTVNFTCKVKSIHKSLKQIIIIIDP